jgi:hypothetical protein
MRKLRDAPLETFRAVRFVLTDMDETLTFNGRLAARTYQALERLQAAGLRVVPVTAAPAGWCDQMARMWPVDGVIGENGGVFFRRAPDGHGVVREYWHGEQAQEALMGQLKGIAARVMQAVPGAMLADDQPFRLTSLAFAQPVEQAARDRLIAAMRGAGLDVTVNNLWVLGWLGGYDKLAMAKRVLASSWGLNVTANAEAVLYTGDSTNDAPMFGFFPHSVGVSTVARYLADIPVPPRWITAGPGGEGFVEAAEAVLRGRG